MREITLIVDDGWYDVIRDVTREVYDGETCQWVNIKTLITKEEE